jgi:hypothetical protein
LEAAVRARFKAMPRAAMELGKAPETASICRFLAVRKWMRRVILCTKQLPVSYERSKMRCHFHIRDNASVIPDDDGAMLDCIRVNEP